MQVSGECHGLSAKTGSCSAAAVGGLCRTKEKGGAMSNPSVVLVSQGNNVHVKGELA